MTELKPCPHCGGDYLHTMKLNNGNWHIRCLDCDSGIIAETEAEAIEAWNTRAPIEYEGWFYLPKPKEKLVEERFGIAETESGEICGVTSFELVNEAVARWRDDLDEKILRSISEAFRQTCKILACFSEDTSGHYYPTRFYELSCGDSFEWNDKEPPRFCPECGAKVVNQ